MAEEHRLAYAAKLKDPRWQRKRLEIMQRDKWMCQRCLRTDRTLNVHHKEYMPGADPWEYPGNLLETICEQCHAEEHGKQDQDELGADRPARKTIRLDWVYRDRASREARDDDEVEDSLAKRYEDMQREALRKIREAWSRENGEN